MPLHSLFQYGELLLLFQIRKISKTKYLNLRCPILYAKSAISETNILISMKSGKSSQESIHIKGFSKVFLSCFMYVAPKVTRRSLTVQIQVFNIHKSKYANYLLLLQSTPQNENQFHGNWIVTKWSSCVCVIYECRNRLNRSICCFLSSKLIPHSMIN